MITWMNKLARKLREKNYFFRRLFDIGMDNLWVDKTILLRFDLESIDFSRKFEKIDIRWYLATVEDCEKWFIGEPKGFPAETKKRFLQLIRRGDWVVFGERVDHEQNSICKPLAHAACVFQFKPMTNQTDFQLLDREGFIMTVFTDPHNRGAGLASGCITEIIRRAHEKGYQTLYIDISTANTPSIRAAMKAGAVLTQSGYYHIRLLKRSLLILFGPLRNRFIRTIE